MATNLASVVHQNHEGPTNNVCSRQHLSVSAVADLQQIEGHACITTNPSRTCHYNTYYSAARIVQFKAFQLVNSEICWLHLCPSPLPRQFQHECPWASHTNSNPIMPAPAATATHRARTRSNSPVAKNPSLRLHRVCCALDAWQHYYEQPCWWCPNPWLPRSIIPECGHMALHSTCLQLILPPQM